MHPTHDWEVIAPSRHGHLRLKPHAHYGFCRHDNFAPLVAPEVAVLTKEAFICFPNNQTDLPHMLLGFRKGDNAYVNDQGQWLGQYVPAALRRHPFALATTQAGQGDEYQLAIDPQSQAFDTQEGQPLFDAQGQLSPAVQERIKLLKAFELQVRQTQAAVRLIEQLGLFDMEQLTIKKDGQQLASIAGLRMINEARLKALDAQGLHSLNQAGALALVYAHQFSKVNLQSGMLFGQLPSMAAQLPAKTPGPAMPSFDLGGDDLDLKFH